MFDVMKSVAPGQSYLETLAQEALAETDNESVNEAVARLAKLQPLEYDQVREDEAKKLGVRVTSLDKEVSAARSTKSSDGGKMAMFPTVSPWSATVNAGEVLDDILSIIKSFIICSDHTAVTTTLWIAFT